MTQQNERVRILHVVGRMNRAGAETLLMHVLRNSDRRRYQMDFLVHSAEPNAFDDDIRDLGGRVIQCLNHARPWRYAQNFKAAISEYGPYDIIHSHIHHYSGIVLRLAHEAGIPVRVVQSHNDTSYADAQASIARILYRQLATYWIHKYATAGIAVSEKAAGSLFGRKWQSDPRWRVLRCGIDLEPFKERVDSAAVKKALGIPPQAFVVGHVGRFQKQKNHRFLVKIAGEITKRDPNVVFLLIGEGPLRAAIESQVSEAGLEKRFVFAGVRPDVPALMLGVMDVMLFPSLYEGLPVTLLETQSACLPCVISDVITNELDTVSPLIHRVSLSEPPSEWARAVMQIRDEFHRDELRASALKMLENGPFNVKNSVKELGEFYDVVCRNRNQQSASFTTSDTAG